MAAADEGTGKIHTPAASPRRKSIGLRSWIVVSELGQSLLEEVGKHSIMGRTGLPVRDLRVLDPLLSYPSSILGRERAIVINIEHIKAVITAKEVLIVNSTSPLVIQFLQDLRHRISRSGPSPPQPSMEGDTEYGAEEAPWGSPALQEQSQLNYGNTVAAGPKVPSFEFRALEACLESACRCLESETETLREEAYPALDELTSKISTLNLERVRQIKSRLVALSSRVQKVRDELEHLLDDDNDIAEMCLTEKLVTRSMDQSFREGAYDAENEVDDKRSEEFKSDDNSEISTSLKPNIEELEMLLEAYFVQIDGTLQKLSDMSEYVDDTEDYINIMLDDKQNQMLQMEVMLGTANMILNAGIVVVGLFGMNIGISLFEGQPIQFWGTTCGTIGGCVAFYLFAMRWGKKKNLLDL